MNEYEVEGLRLARVADAKEADAVKYGNGGGTRYLRRLVKVAVEARAESDRHRAAYGY
jgi:hypothetical protein